NRINLSPLTETETARLVANLLEQAVLSAEVQSAILARSGGNPLYAEEFVRLLKDRGILTKPGPTWTLDPNAEIPMPSGVLGLIAAERVEDHAEILAAHYPTALRLAAASRHASTEEVQTKAVRYLTLAGDRALGIDVEAAERHYARALELTTGDDPHRPGLLVKSGEALRQRGRFPEAARAFEEAIEGLRAQGDVRAMAVAMGRYSLVLYRLGDPRNRGVATEAVAALEPLGPSPELAQALAEEAG